MVGLGEKKVLYRVSGEHIERIWRLNFWVIEWTDIWFSYFYSSHNLLLYSNETETLKSNFQW